MPYSRFSVRESDLSAIIAAAMKSGGDYCDLYFEDTAYWTLMLRDGEVGSCGHHIDYGCGVRVLHGDRTGYAYSESTDRASLLAAARRASTIADGGFAPLQEILPTGGENGLYSPVNGKTLPNGGETGCFSPANPYRAFGLDAPRPYSMRGSWLDASCTDLAAWLVRLDERIRSKDARVSKVIANLSWSISEIMMYNSFGQLCEDSRPLVSISISAVFVQNGKVQNGTASRSLRCGTEFITDTLLEELACETVRGIDERFAARRPKGGVMSVVMGAGASGILLHEAMGHSFEADHCRKGQSVFEGRIGERICRKGINIVDDGTLSAYRGSCAFDDELVPSQKTYMVEDGVLTSYLHDRISARFYGVAPTGNGRRESFRYNPIPRMRSTYMENGQEGTCEDLIAETRNGLFVDEFSNGQVKIGEGDFTFYVKSGFLIENGRLTMPVKDINIIGNGPEALASIRAVASDLIIDKGTWTCGKGQSVPVSCGIPSVIVDGLTVGGE